MYNSEILKTSFPLKEYESLKSTVWCAKTSGFYKQNRGASLFWNGMYTWVLSCHNISPGHAFAKHEDYSTSSTFHKNLLLKEILNRIHSFPHSNIPNFLLSEFLGKSYELCYISNNIVPGLGLTITTN